jgi:predicted alpha-1,2-mannosidase
MIRFLALALVFGLLSACQPGEKSRFRLVEKVNPFIGTGGHGHTYPGASAPFGGVQLSPDTRLDGWDGCGGYHYSDSIIYGFSHTHLSGTGVSDYGDLLLMPFTGNAHFANGATLGVDSGYASRFSHETEVAEAGYYAVSLSDYSVQVELTASKRCGFQRYRFPKGSKDPQVIIDLQHRDELLNFNLHLSGENAVSGYRTSKAWASKQSFFFALECSQNIKEARFNGDSTKLILSFFPADELLIKTGVSAVSEAGAQKNLQAEIPHWDFDKTKAETQGKWEKELAKIEVEMWSAEEESIFYTALYHSFLNPNLFQDVDGAYRGTDQKTHVAKGFTNYTVFSLWDTYRATHPLFTISQRAKTLDFIKTFLHQYQNGGSLPMWELAGNYTGCMIGYHAVPVIVDAYAKGIRDFDTDLALEAMLATAMADELGKRYTDSNGYMASDEEHESVSKNLEYAYDDWCIAQFAKALGKDSIYQVFEERAQYYKNIFEPESGFMRAKRKQEFDSPFDPAEVNFNFTEANSWQYSFYVPQDVSGLIALQGGTVAFERKLDDLFHALGHTSGRVQADITGLIGQYAHGNEPSHHMAYLYSYAGRSTKTQAMVRRILKEMYQNQPDGLIGNEDCGQMSSWYVLSSLGFYPVTPGSADYVLGSPLIKKAVLNLENGNRFSIEAKNQSPENVYIQAIRLNGSAYTKGWISQESILAGGSLIFEMGPEPGTELTPPQAAIKTHLITPVPYVIKGEGPFKDSLVLALKCIDSSAIIYYTLDGSTPDSLASRYDKPLLFKENTSLKAFAKSKGKTDSKVIATKFKMLKTDRKISYSVSYDPQYTGGGPSALIDGEQGGEDFRTGYWQAWQGQDLTLIVDLGPKGEYFNEISTSHLQDIKSWIFMPKAVHFYLSNDGEVFTKLGVLTSTTSDTAQGVHLEKFRFGLFRKRARYVKVVIEHYGELPAWHLSAGEDTWMFIDELEIL